MIGFKASCIKCAEGSFSRYHTYWECQSCGQNYPCVNGIPKLYVETELGKKDKELRDFFYDNLLGRFYTFLMPFLTLPARPVKISLRHWCVYFIALSYLGFLVVYATHWMISRGWRNANLIDMIVLILLLATTLFFKKHRYLFNLLVLAIPVKVSLSINKYRPKKSFSELHAEFQKEYQNAGHKLQILDVSTGTCNSISRHGWMNLNAEYTGIDLSEQMLLKGMAFMTRSKVPMDFVLADAHKLPLKSETFDIVTNYGAVNAYTDTESALKEMVRVAKKGGKLLFLDEQLYDSASFLEKLYFQSVLSSHNVIHHCPVELLPEDLEEVQVHQIYEFYYICTARKKRI